MSGRQALYIFAKLVLFVVILTSPARAAGVDHSIWADLLEKHVSYETGRVDYAAFKKEDEAQLEDYLKVLKTVDRSELTRNERLAFYINLYNSATIKLILESYPWNDSIRDIGGLLESPFKIEFINLEGKQYSLDEIEHDILRKEYNDPRIHFALNCASVSCPPLYDKPYAGAKIDEQLDMVTRRFLNDPRRTWIDEDTLYLSKVMEWYEDDFVVAGGVVPFVKKYADGAFEKNLKEVGDDIDVEFQDYDWSLNDVEG